MKELLWKNRKQSTLGLVDSAEVISLATEISLNHRGNRSLKKTTLPPSRTFRMKMKLTKMGNLRKRSLTKRSHNLPSREDNNGESNPSPVQQVEDSMIESSD